MTDQQGDLERSQTEVLTKSGSTDVFPGHLDYTVADDRRLELYEYDGPMRAVYPEGEWLKIQWRGEPIATEPESTKTSANRPFRIGQL